MKADIIDRIDQALAENRQVKRQRMHAKVMDLLDNPTQLPLSHLNWDGSTTAVTDRDLDMVSAAETWLWRFEVPGSARHLCVRCLGDWVEGDRPFCARPDCELIEVDTAALESTLSHAGLEGLPQPLHRGSVHVRPMVEAL